MNENLLLKEVVLRQVINNPGILELKGLMSLINKTEVFKEELSWIVNKKIRKFAEAAVDRLPDYFFTVAASSTGRYHPTYALGPGGLVRHTKAATMIAHELLGLEMYGKYTSDERDLMIAAIILHDGKKHGDENEASQYTIAEHPAVCAEWVKKINDELALLDENKIEILCSCIASHMGQWNTDFKYKKEILPKPKTAMQKFVHQADYLASRKYLNFDFGDNYYEPDKCEPEAPKEPEPPSELDVLKTKIVELCRSKVSEGVPNKTLYAIIADKNKGNRNPNSILDMETAEIIKKELEECVVE